MAKLNVNNRTMNKNSIRNSIHNDTEVSYKTFEMNGEKIFQIDTYGSPERKIKG